MTDLKTNPLFSVIVPTYNHAKFIKKCLSSIINQTYTNWEAIVVNNFSDDETIDVVNSLKDERIKLINFKNNGVIAASRNEGIRNSEGEWICFLDSDDWWYPKKLETCLDYLNLSDIVFHDLDYFKKNGRTRRRIVNTRHLKKNVFEDLLLDSNALPNSSVVVRKAMLLKIGLLSENSELIAVEDFDCWLRLSKVTNRFFYIPKNLGGYSLGDSNISNTDKQLKRELKLFEIHAADLSPELQKEAENRFSYRVARMEQNMGNFNSAIQNYRKATHCRKFIIKFKSMYFLVQLFLKNKTKNK